MFTKNVMLLLGLSLISHSAHAFSGCRIGDLNTKPDCPAHRQIVCERGARGFVKDTEVPAQLNVTLTNTKTQLAREIGAVGDEITNPSTKGYPLPPFSEIKGNLAHNKKLVNVLGKMGVEIADGVQVHVKTLGLDSNTKLYTNCAATTEIEAPEAD